MNKRYFVGLNQFTGSYVFKSSEDNPTGSDGRKYWVVLGPFKTKQGAEYMAKNHENPQCRTVSDAELLAKE